MTFNFRDPQPIMSFNVFVEPLFSLDSDSFGECTDPTNNPSLSAWRMTYNEIVVVKIIMKVKVYAGADRNIRFGLMRSLAAPPTTSASVSRIPYLHDVSSDTRTARTYTVVFHPSGSDLAEGNKITVGVPGLEWDLKQTAIRAGHPHTCILYDDATAGTVAAPATTIADGIVEYHCQLGGIGPGY